MKTYLLYIDILGFSDLVKHAPDKVDRLYNIINSLNVHQHHAFKTIIFSDTVLVYSPYLCTTEREHGYTSMYGIEFAQDLFYRAWREGIYFRAILDYGEFIHEELSNCSKFYGETLINCYNLEKGLPSLGVFVTKEAQKYQKIFPVAPFSSELFFVFIQQNYYRFSRECSSTGMHTWEKIDMVAGQHWIVQEALIFKKVSQKIKNEISPHVRVKYITYLDFYRRYYSWPLSVWEKDGFGMRKIAPSDKWMPIYRDVIKERY